MRSLLFAAAILSVPAYATDGCLDASAKAKVRAQFDKSQARILKLEAKELEELQDDSKEFKEWVESLRADRTYADAAKKEEAKLPQVELDLQRAEKQYAEIKKCLAENAAQITQRLDHPVEKPEDQAWSHNLESSPNPLYPHSNVLRSVFKTPETPRDFSKSIQRLSAILAFDCKILGSVIAEGYQESIVGRTNEINKHLRELQYATFEYDKITRRVDGKCEWFDEQAEEAAR